MGQGLQKVARLCGGLIAKDKHQTVKYDSKGKIISIKKTKPKGKSV